MNILFSVLSSISTFIGVGTVLLWFRYIKKRPVFLKTDRSNKGIIYPSLSVIIPACNEEESIEQAVRQLISQDYPNLEVIVVNDRSTDKTGAILEKLKIQYPQLKVITIYDLPPNWLGKNHAVYQGVKEATGEWLLFTDADVMFSLGSLKKTLGYALEHALDHLTITPDLYYGGVFYRAFLTYLSFAITATVMFTNKVGVGAFNLVKKSVYKEIGGYEAIAMRVADDMSFGELVVNKGYKQDFGLSGKGFIIVKWYNNLFDLLKGIKKNQFAHFKFSVVTTLGICLYALLVGVYPFVGIFLGPIWARALCGLSVVSLFGVYNYFAKYLNISRSYVVIHPISVLLYIGAILNSMVKTISQGGIEWRGTIYPIKVLKKHI
ncbi:glycosyltransferase family 2 protein [Desulfosporosinus sp. BG]|uniref:glycosyltransferase n=1 Tax=Desulfosporosinus sp. BG TaxID=1633135 RepID=UPI00083B5D16|nr:glycosyltransferase family 2 protein [Desulfosporosinus sp. BG]ODA42570.1 glycosyl transferase, family 2 [Desulfosporosinus sp. BG]